ncbi:hypothetical protein [Paenibacillus popilliae]|uniref:16S rRNA uridine-516 pseudouridylate synthase n=1 Tax=Paenibacillus popilliae ATCC 14706 TaxID=1212764 RepID=M9M7L0_PAEPP|nr:hypothetical protein [Paenibacillus popilliae]GAC43738.1 16S rRNA uridine-516 pseudouridylate synthase [Paenibacillus popilliae ATCC 14706]
MKKKLFVVAVCALAMLGTTSALAYNYKFDFDMNTGINHSAAYSEVAYKYTKDEEPVVRVDSVESKVLMNFVVVNSDDVQRTDTYTTKSAGSHVFTSNGMAQNKQYRLRADTDDGGFLSRYNVTGAWNPDSY